MPATERNWSVSWRLCFFFASQNVSIFQMSIPFVFIGVFFGDYWLNGNQDNMQMSKLGKICKNSGRFTLRPLRVSGIALCFTCVFPHKCLHINVCTSSLYEVWKFADKFDLSYYQSSFCIKHFSKNFLSRSQLTKIYKKRTICFE